MSTVQSGNASGSRTRRLVAGAAIALALTSAMAIGPLAGSRAEAASVSASGTIFNPNACTIKLGANNVFYAKDGYRYQLYGIANGTKCPTAKWVAQLTWR